MLSKKSDTLDEVALPSLTTKFQQKISEIFSNPSLKNPPKSLAVAVSGGSDSLALTFLLQQVCLAKRIKLLAITVDHKMRQSSSDEALRLHKLLQQKKVPHKILKLDSQKLPKNNIEAKLREARYRLLYDYCIKNKIELLFLGHQQNDIAENFLIRLFRGSGLDGLSSIAEVSEFKKIKLVRPILNFEKSQLQNFLRQKKIEWFEDETNSDEKFLRNKIRKFLTSLPEENLLQKRIANAAFEITKMRDFFDDIILFEASQLLEFNESGYFLINLKKFQQIDKKIALKILALTLIETSGAIYKPRLEKLLRFYEWLTLNEAHKPKNFYGCMAEKYGSENLLIYREKKAADVRNVEQFDEKTILIDGRFLIESSKKIPKNLVFPNREEAAKIANSEDMFKKIIPVSLFEKKGNKLVGLKPKFYFRTILKNLYSKELNLNS